MVTDMSSTEGEHKEMQVLLKTCPPTVSECEKIGQIVSLRNQYKA